MRPLTAAEAASQRWIAQVSRALGSVVIRYRAHGRLFSRTRQAGPADDLAGLPVRAGNSGRTGYSRSLTQCHPFSSSQTGRTTLGSAA